MSLLPGPNPEHRFSHDVAQIMAVGIIISCINTVHASHRISNRKHTAYRGLPCCFHSHMKIHYALDEELIPIYLRKRSQSSVKHHSIHTAFATSEVTGDEDYKLLPFSQILLADDCIYVV